MVLDAIYYDRLSAPEANNGKSQDKSQEKALLHGADYVGPQRAQAIAEELITKAGGEASVTIMSPVASDVEIMALGAG
ncbi:hypothetical protein [Saccharopolyspora pogona]|uniref:hypothetical protein n=1 Tax=Saccharopolyspora pogona TaxID=333966 RepID=UPI0016896C2D|nr:hypothetical protein [Saccharopolyspora pogona]